MITAGRKPRRSWRKSEANQMAIEQREHYIPGPIAIKRLEAQLVSHGRIADEIVREVSELPDRTSPDYAPDMMLVNADELRAIVLAALNQS